MNGQNRSSIQPGMLVDIVRKAEKTKHKRDH